MEGSRISAEIVDNVKEQVVCWAAQISKKRQLKSKHSSSRTVRTTNEQIPPEQRRCRSLADTRLLRLSISLCASVQQLCKPALVSSLLQCLPSWSLGQRGKVCSLGNCICHGSLEMVAGRWQCRTRHRVRHLAGVQHRHSRASSSKDVPSVLCRGLATQEPQYPGKGKRTREKAHSNLGKNLFKIHIFGVF